MELPTELIACVLLAYFTVSSQCCGPAEIGQEFNITTHTQVPSGHRVEWNLDTGIVLYNSENTSAPNQYPNVYHGSRDQLTILNVSKNDARNYSLFEKGEKPVYSCNLKVYKRASTPTCETVTLRENNITTKCTTTEVYPQARCQFTLQFGGSDRKNITDGTPYITYSHVDPQSVGNEYYRTSCTLQYPVDGFKPGEWTVQVNMYPDLTGVSLAQGTIGQAVNTLQLSVATVNIDNSTCPKGLAGEGDTNVRDGYIRQGERASCLCTRDQPGNPPGTVGWSSTQGANLVILSKSEDASIIQINSSGTYSCESTTVLNGSTHSLTYTPEYAYGPSSASLVFKPPEPIFLCPNQQTNIDITCHVPENSFNPALLFTIRDGIANNVVDKVAGDTAWSKTVNYNFTKSGQHTFTCAVENAVFSDVFNAETSASSIQVYGPPSDPPKISARSSQNGDILMVNDTVTVTCNVLGGYPSVQSVTLTCGQNKSVTNNGTSSELTLKEIGLSYNETNCTCHATHVTECYDLMGVLPLTVAISSPDQSELGKDSFPLVGGAVGGFVVLAIVVVGVIFCVRRGRKQRDAKRSVRNGYDNMAHDYTEVSVDNSDLYNPYVRKGSADGFAHSQGYDPRQDPTVVFRDNTELYASAAKVNPMFVNTKEDKPQPTMASATAQPTMASATVQPTMASATAQPTMVSATAQPEKHYSDINPYNEIDPEELKKEQKLFAKNSKMKAKTGAKPKQPQVLTPKLKAKPKSPKPNTKGNVTTGAPGGPPFQSVNGYEEVELKDQRNGRPYSLASNDVMADGQGGQSQKSLNNYDEVVLKHPAKK